MQYTSPFQNLPYDDDIMAGRPPMTPASESGARLAKLRKAAGLSQGQLGEAIGVPQRTISFYERKADHIPSDLVPKIADALGVTVEEVLGIEKAPPKRGPKSKIERQLEAVRQLPRGRQQFVSKVLDQLLAGSTTN